MAPEHQEDVKRARSCELCLNKRAVWYCASDDAFLCHVCDESVHSANQVVAKHERVWLRANEKSSGVPQGTTSTPVWHSGFSKKARTRRVRCERRRREGPRVPELGGEGMFFIPETNDDDLTSLVPEFQGFTEMGFFSSNYDGAEEMTRRFNFEEDLYCNDEEAKTEGEQYLMNCTKDYDNVTAITTKTEVMEDYESNRKQRNMLLRLNYENVIAAWEEKQESPRRSQSEFNSKSNFQLVPPGMEEEKKARSKSEREARVWRYRDKRKNRLFEKKIRYEVRKVNADKRPRMKGRFVRRTLASNSEKLTREED